MSSAPSRALFDLLPTAEWRFLTRALRDETIGGVLLLAAAAVAVGWANSPWSDAYDSVRHHTIGPESLHLDLDLEHWAADGLLALFFFVAGLELKRELVCGQLRTLSTAVLPVVAALAGMLVPIVVFFAIAAGAPGAADGWAVPTATDIAVALAVLAVVGPALPPALRAFLLTLAVVDDLGAILIIATVYTSSIDLAALAVAGTGALGYAYLQHRRVHAWWVYVPLAGGVWGFVHASGVHATIAGVALGLLTRVRPDEDEDHSPAERLEHRLRPLAAGVAVPLFALLSAGVALSPAALSDAGGDRVAVAVAAGLVIGKFLGVAGGTWLVARFTRAELAPGLHWGDICGVAALSGVGFTVSLLIGDLAFAGDPARADSVTIAVFAGSLLAAALATLLLRRRNRYHRRRGGGHPGRASGQTVG
ncbi:Na+/H+ antiporter NhaA [Sporichthya sp.]|uniref:Na+/H+ antiporter NhaA n=1 Tax=Sporichthya sp. TaxID=65475 RepID=UPI00183F910A|nr:Na+/H+ antiporter NhaA [Sporichthya sp.]MBA3744030.1 Na+/H+ antiporter NhaA [Sporichthya sp.]